MKDDIIQLKSLEHDTRGSSSNSFIKIDDTHFMLAYEGEENDGYIRILSINEDFDIIKTYLSKHSSDNSYNSLVKIDSTHFMLAYAGDYNVGIIKTFSIDENYAITGIDDLEHESGNGQHNSLVMIDSTHFILAYRGYIKTFSINGSYEITEINSLNHDTTEGEYNSLVMIDSTHFMLAYNGEPFGHGHIKTFSIDGSYAITEIDDLEHDTSLGEYNSLLKIDSTHFILAYKGGDGDGFIKTFSIDGNYAITEIDDLEHDTERGEYNSLIMIDNTHFALAYRSDNEAGHIKTFSINGSYVITQIDDLEHDIAYGKDNSLVLIDAVRFILAYAGAGSDGYIKTFAVRDEFIDPTDAYTENAVFATTPTTDGKIYISLSKDGGVTYTPELLQTFNGTNAYLTYGDGSTELWGTSFNESEINDTNFRLKISCQKPNLAYQVYKNFGFSVPSNRILTGIEVKVKAKWVTDTTSIDNITIKIYYGNSALPIQAGSQVFASDGRKNGEGAGNGSGVLVFYDGSDWMACDSGVIVAA